MELRKVRKIGFGMQCASALILVMGMLLDSLVAVCVILGLTLFIGSLFFLMAFWKCPCCYHVLPEQGIWWITHCPYCGYDLEL